MRWLAVVAGACWADAVRMERDRADSRDEEQATRARSEACGAVSEGTWAAMKSFHSLLIRNGPWLGWASTILTPAMASNAPVQPRKVLVPLSKLRGFRDTCAVLKLRP